MSEVLTSLTDLFSFWGFIGDLHTHIHSYNLQEERDTEKTSFWSPKIICAEEKFTIGIICRGS